MGERILIVDDDSLICDLFRMMLARAGFLIRTALSGVQALKELEAERPDLVLLDVMMADSDGIELLGRIRADERFADLRVIVLTAMVDSHVRLRSINLGANSILVKPVDPDTLVREVRRVLASPHTDTLTSMPGRVEPPQPSRVVKDKRKTQLLDQSEMGDPDQTQKLDWL